MDLCLGRLRRGTGDPTTRLVDGRWWRASNTPEGAVLGLFERVGADVRVRCWGPGSGWALVQSPRLLGMDDHPEDFCPDHPWLAEVARRHPHLRIGATDLACESLLPTVVEQRVTGAEAFRAIRLLTRRFGTSVASLAADLARPGHPAAGMVFPLTAAQWVAIPSWEFLKAGVEQTRSRTVVAAAQRGASIERALARPGFGAALGSLPGIGPWTTARTLQHAAGDPDAWSTGDYHVPGAITLALCGEKLGQVEAEEVLAPFAGHRHRVELLVMVGAGMPERHGPRRSLPTHLP